MSFCTSSYCLSRQESVDRLEVRLLILLLLFVHDINMRQLELD